MCARVRVSVSAGHVGAISVHQLKVSVDVVICRLRPWCSESGPAVELYHWPCKMGGRLVRHSRRLIFQLSEVSVPRRLFQGVLDRIGRLSTAPS